MPTSTAFLDRCLEFSAQIARLLQLLPRHRIGPKIRDQVMASASSIGANVAEGRSAQSRADFISKFEIALKEARETGFRLALIRKLIPAEEVLQKRLAQECYELTAILVASVKTLKANIKVSAKSEIRDQK